VIPYEPRRSPRCRPSAVFGRTSFLLLVCSSLAACEDAGPLATPDGSSGLDASVTPDAPPADMGPMTPVDAPPILEDAPVAGEGGTAVERFCDLGTDVAGASVPGGFCLRRYATVKVARTLTFAPNGDLFVGAPGTGTAGGASGGPGAIVVLSDDNHDGVAEATNFLDGVMDVHGLTLGDGYLYFTTQTSVWRTPYTPGQRHEQGPRQDLGLPSSFGQGGRWTHGLAHSVAGNLYASRGQYGSCGGNPGGEISRVGMGQLSMVANGFRNPMYLRCHFRDDACAATELGEDGQAGAKEKLVGLRTNPADYGYPCCFSKDAPIPTAQMTGACAGVRLEDASFVLSDTPFGFDWEHELWPEPYKGAVFVALHGSFYTNPAWAGARIVFASVDPMTHMPVEGWRDFVGGFGPAGSVLERPSDVTFSADGRMFFADDQGGGVYWIAPRSLARGN
jgi:glucose/arabinose dehydrogenase